MAQRLGFQQSAELPYCLQPLAPGYYGAADCTPLFERFGRLDDSGFTAELVAHVSEQFPAFNRVWDSRAAHTPGAGKGAKRQRRRASVRKPRPLTDRQRDALELLARHDGNVQIAAEEWGISRQAMSKLKHSALEKALAAGQKDLAVAASKPSGHRSKRPQRLPRDPRGQEILANPDAAGSFGLDG